MVRCELSALVAWSVLIRCVVDGQLRLDGAVLRRSVKTDKIGRPAVVAELRLRVVVEKDTFVSDGMRIRSDFNAGANSLCSDVAGGRW